LEHNGNINKYFFEFYYDKVWDTFPITVEGKKYSKTIKIPSGYGIKTFEIEKIDFQKVGEKINFSHIYVFFKVRLIFNYKESEIPVFFLKIFKEEEKIKNKNFVNRFLFNEAEFEI